jgi:hypothetical protein
MVASTLPVQWLVPLTGWRFLFVALAALILLSMVIIVWKVPAWQTDAAVTGPSEGAPGVFTGVFKGYGEVWRHPYFRAMAPLGFFSYGGLVAMQTLWAGPWMVRVSGYTPLQAATGLFWLNVMMLCTFWSWGMLNPWLARRGLHANLLITRGAPLSFIAMIAIILLEHRAGAVMWALFCMSCSFASLSQPAVGMAFPAALAGRALSAFNLVIFGGVFCLQWGIGLAIDALGRAGWGESDAFRIAFGAFWTACAVSYLAFVLSGRRGGDVRADNGR